MIEAVATKHARSMARGVHAMWHRTLCIEAVLVNPRASILDIVVRVNSAPTYAARELRVIVHTWDMPPALTVENGIRQVDFLRTSAAVFFPQGYRLDHDRVRHYRLR